MKVIVIAPKGKMGKLVTAAAAEREGVEIVAGIGPETMRVRPENYSPRQSCIVYAPGFFPARYSAPVTAPSAKHFQFTA